MQAARKTACRRARSRQMLRCHDWHIVQCASVLVCVNRVKPRRKDCVWIVQVRIVRITIE